MSASARGVLAHGLHMGTVEQTKFLKKWRYNARRVLVIGSLDRE
jgi:hypothetical protein